MLYALMNRAGVHATKPSHAGSAVRAAEAWRRDLLASLTVDQVRVWMDLGERQAETLLSLTFTLTAAHIIGEAGGDTPDLRVIRGALSAAANRAEAGAIITADDGRAFASACTRAADIIRGASIDELINAGKRIKSIRFAE